MARPEGFEPPTPWFVARYSIQLSYGRVDCGGERGIRTLDGLLAHTPLAGERLRPLGHLSSQSLRIITGIPTPSIRPYRVIPALESSERTRSIYQKSSANTHEAIHGALETRRAFQRFAKDFWQKALVI
jgi:hypothetical protein